MSHSERKEMVIGDDKLLSIRKQCKILRISRSSFYYQPKEASSETLSIMNRMDELFMAYPFYGSRQMMVSLQREGISIGRHPCAAVNADHGPTGYLSQATDQ